MLRPDEAVIQLQRAVHLRPDDGNTLYNAACVYGVLRKRDDALDMLRRAIAAGYGNFDWAAATPIWRCCATIRRFTNSSDEPTAPRDVIDPPGWPTPS
jgi:tetratricopeptide (TPR) repeat protein